jgi:phenylacetate-CoA ligase
VRIDQIVFREFVYLPATLLKGQNVSGRLAQLLRSERVATEERRAQQEAKLTGLVAAARQSCPEYRRRLPKIGVDTMTLEMLREFPTLSKQDLQNYRDGLLSVSRQLFCVEKTTGGSTGEPVTIRKTRDAMAWELAATWRGYEWAGVRIGDKQARFWGVPLTRRGRLQAKLTDFVCHRRRFSAFNFDRTTFGAFHGELTSWRADYLYGYASMIAEFARWHLESGHRLSPPPRAAITTSEVLSPADRSAIQDAFGCRVFNEYGCGELGTIAHECEHGRLHISDENMIVEILDGDRPCGSGEKGEIVVTELNNTALPLIRYRTGDFGALTEEKCPCGRTLGVLSTVFGRAYDFIVAPDGRRFHAEYLMYVFEEAQRNRIGISQFQVRQSALDRIEISVVPAPGGFPEEQQARLTARIHELLGGDMQVSFARVDRIRREPSGKMRVIVGLSNGSACPVQAE